MCVSGFEPERYGFREPPAGGGERRSSKSLAMRRGKCGLALGVGPALAATRPKGARPSRSRVDAPVGPTESNVLLLLARLAWRLWWL